MVYKVAHESQPRKSDTIRIYVRLESRLQAPLVYDSDPDQHCSFHFYLEPFSSIDLKQIFVNSLNDGYFYTFVVYFHNLHFRNNCPSLYDCKLPIDVNGG